MLGTVRLPIGMFLAPALDVFVRVLDHHDCGVDHRADGDRDPTQRHDVRVDPLVLHDDECHEHAQRQRDDRHECRTQVKQECEAHERNDDEFLDELFRQVADRALDQLRAVIGLHDLDAVRQAGLELSKLGLHRLDGLERVLSRAHHDDAARHFAFAVELRNTAAQFWTELKTRHIAEAHRDARGTGRTGMLRKSSRLRR